jgi:FkbM family methyltransferase
MLQKLARMPTLRRLVLPVLKMFGPFDTTIRHHWWPEFRFKLNCYRHRGYWYKGRKRERHVMEAIAVLAKLGDTIVEVGGHIGYVTLHLRGTVGETGKVVVFEPGSNNLPYLKANIASFANVELVEAACGDHDGQVNFWIESLSGQNNSLDRQYKNFDVNRKAAYSQEGMSRITVPMTTLDSYLAATGLRPSLLKIDVEGAENLVLRGAERCLAEIRPTIIVEVTDHSDEVTTLLRRHRYRIRADGHAEWVCMPEEIASQTAASAQRALRQKT